MLIDNNLSQKKSVKSTVLEFLEKNEISYSIMANDDCESICIDLNGAQSMYKKNNYYSPLIVQTSNKDICKVYPYEIMYIAIEDRDSVLYLIDKRKIKTNYNISYWDNILPTNYFARPHNSYIVNLDYVTEVTHDFVYLKYKGNQYSVYTSQRKLSAFKKAFLTFAKEK